MTHLMKRYKTNYLHLVQFFFSSEKHSLGTNRLSIARINSSNSTNQKPPTAESLGEENSVKMLGKFNVFWDDGLSLLGMGWVIG